MFNSNVNGSQPPSPSELTPSPKHVEDMESNTADNTTPPATATEPAPASGAIASASASANAHSQRSKGFDLLFAASQVEIKPKETTKTKAEAICANAEVEVPSTVTVVSITGTGTTEPGGEAASNRGDDDEEEAPFPEYDGGKPTAGADTDDDAVEDQDQTVNIKSFPQVLQIILNTPEYESIAHWLPDGLSFIIKDKQRFSDEILPKYFNRVSLFHSFIRKLNRYGFRRVKGSCKGEESSFAHNNFVRDKPRLCLKMNCQSKPSYHKVPSAMMTTHQGATNTKRFANANAGLIAMPTAVSPILMDVGGMMDAGSSAFVATTIPMTYLPAAASHSAPVLPMAAAAAIQQRQLQLQLDAPMLPGHYQQRILHERQMHTLQMRQRLQHEMQLQQLHEIEMSVYNEDHLTSSYDSYIQSALIAHCRRRDMLRRNIYY